MKLASFLAFAVLVPSAVTPARAALPILNDDYARARAEATERRLPLFVDVWAPW